MRNHQETLRGDQIELPVYIGLRLLMAAIQKLMLLTETG
jgi:hypothetical protein